MGRILIVVGVLMVGAGFILPFASSFNPLGAFDIQDAITPTAEEYCNPGETIDAVGGASTQTSPGNYGRIMSYFCVNAAGERREVTNAVNEDVIGTVDDILGSVGQMFSGWLPTVGLSCAGIALIIVGALMSVRRGIRGPRQVVGVGSPFASNSPIGTQLGSAPIGSAPAVTVNQQSFGGQHDAKSVVNFVRDQLDAAYRSGQISREDYDRAIEKLNQR